MEILSPYGKDVKSELSRVYHIQSLDELQRRVKTALREAYDLHVIAFELLHIAFCMCIRLQTDQGTYYLKTIGKGINHTPDEMLHYMTYLRAHGLPLPEIITTQSGKKHFAMLPDSTYNITFLLTPVQGQPIACNNPIQIQNFATMLAKLHHLGNQFAVEHGTFEGAEAARFPFTEYIPKELPKLLKEGLEQHAHILTTKEKNILKQAHHDLHQWCVQKAHHLKLEKTHIHGDVRMCHVYQENDVISGIIDLDQSCYAPRLVDICFGMISAPTQNDGKTLDIAGQQLFLKTYHKISPLTQPEQESLHAFLLWANLEQFWDLCGYHTNDPKHVTHDKLSQNIEEIENLTHGNVFTL